MFVGKNVYDLHLVKVYIDSNCLQAQLHKCCLDPVVPSFLNFSIYRSGPSLLWTPAEPLHIKELF